MKAGFDLYCEIAKSNELGLSPALWDFYERVLIPQMGNVDLTRKDVMALHYQVYHRPISKKLMETEYLPVLESAGLITQEDNPENRHEKLITVLPAPHGIPPVLPFNPASVYGIGGKNEKISTFTTVQDSSADQASPAESITYTDPGSNRNTTSSVELIPEGPDPISGTDVHPTQPSQPSQPSLPTCGQCARFHTVQCAKIKPELIRYEVTFAGSCHSFQPREAAE